MSMHLEKAWLSTTSTKKKTEKITKAKQEELERGWRERNVRLKEMGLAKETFEQYLDWVYGRGQKNKAKSAKSSAKICETSKNLSRESAPKEERPETSTLPRSLGSWITGPVSSKPSPIYTGESVIGVAVMHKSNLVPIFTDDEAKDISKMRR